MVKRFVNKDGSVFYLTVDRERDYYEIREIIDHPTIDFESDIVPRPLRYKRRLFHRVAVHHPKTHQLIRYEYKEQ